MAIQLDGKILVAGYTGTTYSDFALARYNGVSEIIVSVS
jgi:hypothetical protein